LLLRQHLRDMEDALSAKEAKLKRKLALRKQAQQEHDKFLQQTGALEQDLDVAIKKNKDDIARLLIKKIKPLNDLRLEIAQHIRTLDEEIADLRDLLEQQQLKYEQIKHRAVEYCHQSRSQVWQKEHSDMMPNNGLAELSSEEIELELLKRKEALGALPSDLSSGH
jgi:phage shock protein A